MWYFVLFAGSWLSGRFLIAAGGTLNHNETLVSDQK